jgi:hypothetical protein
MVVPAAKREALFHYDRSTAEVCGVVPSLCYSAQWRSFTAEIRTPDISGKPEWYWPRRRFIVPLGARTARLATQSISAGDAKGARHR